MGQKQRVKDLERRTKPEADPPFLVVWPNEDGTVTVGTQAEGEVMLPEEVEGRFPGVLTLWVKYES